MSNYVKLSKLQVKSRLRNNKFWKGIMVPNKCSIASEQAQQVEFSGINGINEFEKKYNEMDFHLNTELGTCISMFEAEGQ